jgi:AcrR family transcriptional regulator
VSSESIDDADLTGRANIRNAALRLFAERGPDAVTMRQIAEAAGVSPALVVHHFGNKEGLRAAVNAHAGRLFDQIFPSSDGAGIATMADLAAMATGSPGSLVDAFLAAVPPDSPLPAYLRRVLLSGDAEGVALFKRWYEITVELMTRMDQAGLTRPSTDPAVRAALLLVTDLGLLVLREQVAAATGLDPLAPDGMQRWATEATAVYARGIFVDSAGDSPPAHDERTTHDEHTTQDERTSQDERTTEEDDT